MYTVLRFLRSFLAPPTLDPPLSLKMPIRCYKILVIIFMRIDELCGYDTRELRIYDSILHDCKMGLTYHGSFEIPKSTVIYLLLVMLHGIVAAFFYFRLVRL